MTCCGLLVLPLCLASDVLPAKPTLRPLPPTYRAPVRVVARARIARRAPTEREQRAARFAEGVRLVTAYVRLGDQRLNSVSLVLPDGVKRQANWSHTGIALPNGSVRHGLGLASWWRQGNGGWGHWGFVRLYGHVKGSKKRVQLFPPGLLTHADAYADNAAGHAELHYQRRWPDGASLGLTLRFVRYPRDSYVYGICRLQAKGVTPTHLAMSGYPNTTHAPGSAGRKTLGYTRCAVLEGADGSIVKGRREPVRDKGWTFLYNRGALQPAGMTAVYLPSEVTEASAAGSYGVTLTLALRDPAGCRFALDEWRHPTGWAPELEQLTRGKAEQVRKRLQRTRFAWPDSVVLPSQRERAALTRLAGADLPAELGTPLRSGLAELDAAIALLRTADAQARFAAERRVRVAMDRVRQARDAALGHWIAHLPAR